MTLPPKTKFTRKDSADAPSEARTPTPNVPLRVGELPWERWQEGQRFGGADIPLGALAGGTQIGVNLMELPPKKQSCPFHWHQREEEHFYVLAGRCVLRSGAERHEMGPGSYVCFPAGTRVAHAFENTPSKIPSTRCVVCWRSARRILTRSRCTQTAEK